MISSNTLVTDILLAVHEDLERTRSEVQSSLNVTRIYGVFSPVRWGCSPNLLALKQARKRVRCKGS
jgi:hypothetical protein